MIHSFLHFDQSAHSLTSSKSIPSLPSQQQVIRKEPVKSDLSKINIGSRVNHKAFGKGTIISFDKSKDKLIVKFDKENIEKTFLANMSFSNGFLTVI